jgi:segregation and condensation protein A
MEIASIQGPVKQNFHLKDFEGPLDLLLFLIKKNEVNIYDIPIAQITDQYLAFLRAEETVDMDSLTGFQDMAAALLYIKSRMLLPVQTDEEDNIEDPRDELVTQLIEYQRYKRLAELMENQEKEAEWAIERKKLQRTLPFNDENLWQKLDVWDLLKSFSKLMANMSRERIIDMYEEVSVNEKVALMAELLDKKGECSFSELLTKRASALDIVCAFMAILESVKDRLIVIYQHRMFGDILIRRSATDGNRSGAA